MAATVNKNGVLAGQVAVITGASRGIREAIAIRYAMEGAKVVVNDLSPRALWTTATTFSREASTAW